MDNHIALISSLIDILVHIKEVEQDVNNLSKDSTLAISEHIAQSSVAPSEQVIKAIQLQDVISQQLGATTSTIDEIVMNLKKYIHAIKEDSSILAQSIEKLDIKLKKSLCEAKDKKSSFGGKAMGEHMGENDNVEFF